MTGINTEDACEAYNIVVYRPQLACTHTSGMCDANEAVTAANNKKNEERIDYIDLIDFILLTIPTMRISKS